MFVHKMQMTTTIPITSSEHKAEWFSYYLKAIGHLHISTGMPGTENCLDTDDLFISTL